MFYNRISENNLRIIGSFLKNNRLKFWESRNRIMGEILSIISQSLVVDHHTHSITFIQPLYPYHNNNIIMQSQTN